MRLGGGNARGRRLGRRNRWRNGWGWGRGGRWFYVGRGFRCRRKDEPRFNRCWWRWRFLRGRAQRSDWHGSWRSGSGFFWLLWLRLRFLFQRRKRHRRGQFDLRRQVDALCWGGCFFYPSRHGGARPLYGFTSTKPALGLTA